MATTTSGPRRPTSSAGKAPAAAVVPHLSVAEQIARGKAARAEVPRSSHAVFEPVPTRVDPVELLERQAAARVPELVPIRYGRMLVSLCGWTLARAHARSGDRIAIASYLGNSHKFDRAMLEFSKAYAERNERDYQALAAAVKSGRVKAETGL